MKAIPASLKRIGPSASLWRLFGNIFPRNPQPHKIGGKMRTEGTGNWLEVLGCSCESNRLLVRRSQKSRVMEQLSWTDDSVHWDERAYDYAAPHKDGETSAEAELIKALQATRAFRRLSDIRFLGALDYFLVSRPNGAPTNSRYTRAQHSLGVAKLSRTYLALRNHSLEDRLLCVAAAMLHDIGHPPFSHTLEPVFCELFGLDHHIASEQIIRGETTIGLGISETLASFDVSPQSVIEILDGTLDPFEGFFSGPINFDTVEGILRCRHYLKMDNMGITPVRVVEAASNREQDSSREVVDGFWMSKHEVYNLMIRSRPGVLCDLLFQEIMRRSYNNLGPDDFYSTEAQIFRKIPQLRQALRKDKVLEIVYSVLPKKVHYEARNFFVNRMADFSSAADKQRYRQTKIPLTLTLDEFLPA